MRDRDRRSEAIEFLMDCWRIRVSAMSRGADCMRRLKEETEKLGTMSREELADLVNNMKKFNVDDIYDALYQAAIDVLHSDIPLGGKSRRFIALIFENQWNAFYDPKFDRQRKKILCGYDRGAEA